MGFQYANKLKIDSDVASKIQLLYINSPSPVTFNGFYSKTVKFLIKKSQHFRDMKYKHFGFIVVLVLDTCKIHTHLRNTGVRFGHPHGRYYGGIVTDFVHFSL